MFNLESLSKNLKSGSKKEQLVPHPAHNYMFKFHRWEMKIRALTKQPGSTDRGKPSNQIGSPPPSSFLCWGGKPSISSGWVCHTTKDPSEALNVSKPGRRLVVVNIEELASGDQTTQPTGGYNVCVCVCVCAAYTMESRGFCLGLSGESNKVVYKQTLNKDTQCPPLYPPHPLGQPIHFLSSERKSSVTL